MKISQTQIDGMQADVRAHCVECQGGGRGKAAECKSVKCRLYKWRRIPEQQDLFQPLKNDFFAEGVRFARDFFGGTPKYWDDFIMLFLEQWGKPVHPNWTGQLAIELRKSGLKRLDISRPSKANNAKSRRVNAWVI